MHHLSTTDEQYLTSCRVVIELGANLFLNMAELIREALPVKHYLVKHGEASKQLNLSLSWCVWVPTFFPPKIPAKELSKGFELVFSPLRAVSRRVQVMGKKNDPAC